MAELALQSTLQGISSNILLNGEEDFKNISVSFLLSLRDHEDIPVTVQWHGSRYRYIPTEFLVVKPGHYNYADVPLEFLLVSKDVLEDIPIVFSIMRQAQTFTSYIMQKLYTVLTTLAGTITISDWNVRPNKTWYIKVVADAVTLYDTLADMTNDANPVAAGIADSTTFQVYLFYEDLSDVELYYEDFAYHLVLSSITSTGKFKVKPLTDMSELRHAIYNNSNIVLSKGEAELNLHTYVTIKRELVLGTHTPEMEIGDVVNFASARRGLIGENTQNSQVLSLSITGEISEDGSASLVDSIQIAKYMELYR